MSIRKEIRRQIKKILMEETEYDEKYGFPIVKSTKSTGEVPPEEEYGKDLGDGKSGFGTVTFKGTKASTNDSFLLEILENCISEKGSRKDVTDLFSLDGGTFGIAHFAAGGMGGIYEALGDAGIKKYFSKYNPEIDTVEKIKDATRGREGGEVYCRWGKKVSRNDGTKRTKYQSHPKDCWQRYEWWKQGMYDFVNSSEAASIQKETWLKSHGRPGAKLAKQFENIHPEWMTKRGVAVLVCFVNSGGISGAKRWTRNGNRTPNQSIIYYCRNIAERVRSRILAINHYYPDPNFKDELKKQKYKAKDSIWDSYSPKTISASYRRQYKPPAETAKAGSEKKNKKNKKG